MHQEAVPDAPGIAGKDKGTSICISDTSLQEECVVTHAPQGHELFGQMHALSMPATTSKPAMRIDILQALPLSLARPSAQTDPTRTAATPVDKQQASAAEEQRGQLGCEDEYADMTTEDDNRVCLFPPASVISALTLRQPALRL